MKFVQQCPEKLPIFLERSLEKVAKKWYYCKIRPRIKETLLKHWDELIYEWIKDKNVPIFVRKFKERSQRIQHNQGRTIILTDNTPAIWSFSQACQGYKPDFNKIKDLIKNREIPIVFAISAKDKGNVVKTEYLEKKDDLNKKGWKVCHIDEVGLNTQKNINDIPLDSLEERFKRLISPSNMFLVPKTLSGLGELPQVINVMRKTYKK
jgi:hypothetical protein